jgi:Mn2+/Fe2+ NRAMP family transporter
LERSEGFPVGPQGPVFDGLVGLVAIDSFGGTTLNLVHVNPIRLLILAAVINGVTSAPLLMVVMLLSGSRRLMGEQVNGKPAKAVGWVTVATRASAAIALFATGRVSP